VERTVALAAEARGGLPAGATVTQRADAREPVEIAAGREGSFFVDPYTGRVLGENAGKVREAFHKIVAWHRWLGVEGDPAARATARAITGACNLAFLFLVLSGAWLWLPRSWRWKHVRSVFWFRGGLSGKARDFNWHNTIGLWMLLPLAVVVATALPMSYQWANDLLYRMTGSEPPRGGRPQRPEGGGPGRRDAKPPSLDGLDAAWARAEAESPGWKSISLRLPASPHEPLIFTVDRGNGGQPQKRATLTIDRATASVVRRETFEDGSAGRRLRSWTRFLHTGEALGIVGQTIVGLASAGGVLLVWTGISLALRRFAGWRTRRQRKDAEQVETEAAAT
jgi:uncharacterized iron-regulated membrane protein